MKTEKELRVYAENVLAQLQKEKQGIRYLYTESGNKVIDPQSVNNYAINQAKTILSTLMYVLDDYTICDLNRI